MKRLLILLPLGIAIIFAIQSAIWGPFHDVPLWWTYAAAPLLGLTWGSLCAVFSLVRGSE